ncbi:hypothetical protein [Anaerocolumna chitinilytica]|uniref:Uncharacterized protein n=1 Tax=Anaerocolumna chitinilytica TaxID=1727145 RepID=A0A7I8DNL9_9FIRM|nr:hypothetical protein [Anaerocolumna chitinilytica]BCK00004.1 hypothetical protein bsdcttw_30440 [Anaerocolumna chitinilytica]
MKKTFWGYSVSEVDIIINTLREENESLNATITTLKTQIKNSETSGAKANLLEADLRMLEEDLNKLNEEKLELLSQISSFKEESEALKQQNESLNLQLSQLQLQNAKQIDLQHTEDPSFDKVVQTEQELQDMTDEIISAESELKEAIVPIKEIMKVQLEIDTMKDEVAISNNTAFEQLRAKTIDCNSQDNLNQMSEISLHAYGEMSKMRNEVIDYIHTQMKEYYKMLDENNAKLYKVSNTMDAIMADFIKKSNDYLKTDDTVRPFKYEYQPDEIIK